MVFKIIEAVWDHLDRVEQKGGNFFCAFVGTVNEILINY